MTATYIQFDRLEDIDKLTLEYIMNVSRLPIEQLTVDEVNVFLNDLILFNQDPDT